MKIPYKRTIFIVFQHQIYVKNDVSQFHHLHINTHDRIELGSTLSFLGL